MNKFVRRLSSRNRHLWRAYRCAFDLALRVKTRALASRLSGNPDADVRKVAQAVAMLATGGEARDRRWAEAIEDLRVAMLDDGSPLVDGTLGEPGIYDGGDNSIASACLVSKPPRAAFFLYCLVRAFGSRRILELGTNVGISSAYLAAACSRNASEALVETLESSRYRQRVAMRLHQKLELDNVSYVQGLFSDTLATVLEGPTPPDFAFIDGHHQYQPTLDYLDQVAARTASGCVFVFDDIDWSDGMKRAWKVIQEDARFSVVIDFRTVGVCVLGPAGGSPRFVAGPHRVF